MSSVLGADSVTVSTARGPASEVVTVAVENSATGAGSLSTMVTVVDELPPSTPLTGADKVMVTVSGSSIRRSSMTVRVRSTLVCPAGMITGPCVTVKSIPESAVPELL